MFWLQTWKLTLSCYQKSQRDLKPFCVQTPLTIDLFSYHLLCILRIFQMFVSHLKSWNIGQTSFKRNFSTKEIKNQNLDLKYPLSWTEKIQTKRKCHWDLLITWCNLLLMFSLDLFLEKHYHQILKGIVCSGQKYQHQKVVLLH